MDLLEEIQAFYEKNNFMTILSFYIERDNCFVTLKLGDKVIENKKCFGEIETQAMVLIPFIQKAWNEAGNPEINYLMTPRGPGSFTSLRVALAAAQGLELAFPKARIFSPTHFDVLAYAARLKTKGPFVVLIDSKKGDFYGQFFVGKLTQEPQVYTHESLEILLKNNPEVQVIMDVDNSHGDFFQNKIILNDKNLATCQIELSEKEPTLRENPDCQKFQPFYLYLPDYVKRKSV